MNASKGLPSLSTSRSKKALTVGKLKLTTAQIKSWRKVTRILNSQLIDRLRPDSFDEMFFPFCLNLSEKQNGVVQRNAELLPTTCSSVVKRVHVTGRIQIKLRK